MLKNQLDTRFGTLSRKRTTGDIGIEIELEGILTSADQDKYWSSKEEGSLRHGVEYVFSRPVYMKELDLALAEFSRYMKTSTPKLSIRCSTHMHINIIDKTVRQIYTIMAYYYMIEDILVSTQGPIRTGNLFCLRLSDAEGLSESVRYSLKDQLFFKAFNLGHHKYAALNLSAPQRFGSLEFRFLRPMVDTKLLTIWAWLLYNMVENAAALSISRILEAAQMGTHEFLKMVFNKAQIEFILDGRGWSELDHMLVNNYDHVSKMAFHLDYKRKFYIEEENLDDDLEGSPFRVSRAANKAASLAAFEAEAEAALMLANQEPPPMQAMPGAITWTHVDNAEPQPDFEWDPD